MSSSRQPSLTTARFSLVPFALTDAPELQRTINDYEIAMMTRHVDFPYTLEMGEAWLARHEGLWNEGKAAIFAIRQPATGELVGGAGLEICSTDHFAELGYWIARKYWNQGVATEAAAAVVEFGFDQLGLNRIVAHHMTRNPASGRVLEKLGMTREGLLRRHARKWGEFHDVVIFGILAEDWEKRRKIG
ncbi:MAG: GNAT family protein [Pirellulaceae bacterium]